MVTAVPQRTLVEHPVIIQRRGGDLFGVLTLPQGESTRGIGVILLVGGAYIPSTNRNRLFVYLARELACQGFHVLRFDYHGIGESAGEVGGYRLDRPFAEDLEAAIQWMREIGLRRFLPIGACFGARTILATAERIDGLVGTVLISTPLRDFRMGEMLPTRYVNAFGLSQSARRIGRSVARSLLSHKTRAGFFRIRRSLIRTSALKTHALLDWALRRERPNGHEWWISPHFVSQFKQLSAREIPILLLYGSVEQFYKEFEQARAGTLHQVLAGAKAVIDVQVIEGNVHGFANLHVQEDVVHHTSAWIRRVLSS